MTRNEALQNAKRKANELQENFVVFRVSKTGLQWMFSNERIIHRTEKGWTYYDLQIVKPNIAKSSLTFVDHCV